MNKQIWLYLPNIQSGAMGNKIRIVLIEDDADDVELLQEALESRNVPFSMTLLKDGSAAISHFQQTEEFPDIVIMDFNLPRVHGREVIKKIRSNPRFSKTPILILSTSSSKEDIAYAYQVGADKYLVKPATVEAIRDTVNTILELARNTAFSVM